MRHEAIVPSTAGSVVEPGPAAAAEIDGVVREATTVRADLGLELAATWHRGERRDRGVVVVAPGVAVPASRMWPLADDLAAHGWEALTFDYAGMGASLVGHARDRREDRLSDWGSRDLDALLRTAIAVADGRPVTLVGHSAGAWLLGFTEAAAELDAVVALASMSGYWGNHKRSARPALLAYWYALFPVLTRTLGYVPGRLGLGMDLPGGVAAQWTRWNRRPDFYPGDPDVADQRHMDALTAPVLDLLASDDEWATMPAAEAMWSAFTNADVTYRVVTPRDAGVDRIGHVGLMDDRLRTTVWPQVHAWLEGRRRVA